MSQSLSTFNSNNILKITTSNIISSTKARDSGIMRTVINVCLTAVTLEPTHRKRHSFRWAGAKTGFLCVMWSSCGSGETQHLTDDGRLVNVPCHFVMTIIITEWATLVINCSTVGSGIVAFQCYVWVCCGCGWGWGYSGPWIMGVHVGAVPIMQPAFKLLVFTVGVTFNFVLCSNYCIVCVTFDFNLCSINFTVGVTFHFISDTVGIGASITFNLF